ncbi:MAG TPA: allantoate amidohydrolase [Terracidiphilus sp.]|jgi:allantoate deiminase|nr:allantoate amidohydrolase [Terracidiphilus sp.]
MKDRARRAIEECLLIAAMTEEPGHITRRFLTPPVHDVHMHLRARMEAMGMSVRVDAAGNLRGIWQPQGASGKCLIMGSHIDTVPDAGAYDGVLGVMLALELVSIAKESASPLAIEVIAFSEEEGVRFGVPFVGSRAVAGRFDPGLLALKDTSGTTIEAAIRDFGLDPGRLSEAAAEENAIGFFEIHIEQGPVLESEKLSIAAVTGIVGQTRRAVEFAGQANHAGTTPMELRRDALAAAAEWISAVEAHAKRSEGLVANVGRIVVTPNAGNVIAGTARMTLDVRHPHDALRLGAVTELEEMANKIAERRELALQITHQLDQPAVPMDERLTAYLAESIGSAGFPLKRMPSGAGHDAMVMAGRMPSAMLFLRSPGGISHNPAETVRDEDVEAALLVGRKFLERLAAVVG